MDWNRLAESHCCRLSAFLSVGLSIQIQNIDACLTFLAAKGVNIQGLSAEGGWHLHTDVWETIRAFFQKTPNLPKKINYRSN